MKKHKLSKLKNRLSNFKYKCKENCFECCTAFPLLEEELKDIKKELRKQWYTEPPKWKWDKYCELLTTEWKCSVYNVRPVICRSFSDRVFIMKSKFRKIWTQCCTYWIPKQTEVINEYNEYWNEVIEKWIIIWCEVDKLLDNPLEVWANTVKFVND